MGLKRKPDVGDKSKVIGGQTGPHKVTIPTERECTCEAGEHVPVWSGWFTDDIEGVRIYCRRCNSIWSEI